MKKYYCTYFDRNYLIKAIALIESLADHEKNPFELYIVCLDEFTRILLDKLNYPFVNLIPFHEIESKDQGLIQARKNRSLVEYYWTLTPNCHFKNTTIQSPHSGSSLSGCRPVFLFITRFNLE